MCGDVAPCVWAVAAAVSGMAFTAYTAWNNHNKTLPVTWEKWGVRRPTALGV
jgi:hypothetical protein